MSRSRYMKMAPLAALAATLAMAACGGGQESGGGGEAAQSGEPAATVIKPIPGASGKTVAVGSKNFTEQFVLGEIYAQALEAAGFKVTKELNLGSEQIAFRALQEGQIDGYPEYTGTALTSFFDVKIDDVPKDPDQAYQQTKSEFASEQITALPRTPFENTYRLGMTKETQKKLGNVTTTSQLAGKESDLTISGFPECRQRTDCLIGVERTYGLDFGRFLASEAPYEVLDNGQADVAFVFTTDSRLTLDKYATLEDDKSLFPPYNITFAIRNEALRQIGPEGQKVIETVQKPLTVEVMQELNSRVDLDKQEPEQVAAAYLKEAGFVK